MKTLLFLLVSTAAFSAEGQWTSLSTSTSQKGIPHISSGFLDAEKIERVVVMPGYFESSGIGPSDYIAHFLAFIRANPNFEELNDEEIRNINIFSGLRGEQWFGIYFIRKDGDFLTFGRVKDGYVYRTKHKAGILKRKEA